VHKATSTLTTQETWRSLTSYTIGAFHGLVPLVDIAVLKHRGLTSGLQVRASIPGYGKKVSPPPQTSKSPLGPSWTPVLGTVGGGGEAAET
jgi:hypothetical protein